MTGRFRNYLQAALLYDSRAGVTPSLALSGFRREMLELDIPLKVVRESADSVLMMGPHELQLTCTYYEHPADQAVFSRALLSSFTRMLVPDAEERVRRHQSHVLIEIQQGVFGSVEDDKQIAAMFQSIGFSGAGRDLVSFNRRVGVLSDACLALQATHPASLVHWTQSNTLLPGEKLEAMLTQRGPGPLTIHPMIFGGPEIPGSKMLPVEIYTIGAADYIGRELHADLAPIPWLDMYQALTSFVALATMPNGYIIPDGNTFGVEGDEFSWLVTYLDGKVQQTVNGEPFFNLKLLYHRGHGYTAPDFVGRELITGGIPEASTLMRGSEKDKREQLADWEKNQKLAVGVGGQFLIYKKGDPSVPPPASASSPRKVFGRLTERLSTVFGKKN